MRFWLVCATLLDGSSYISHLNILSLKSMRECSRFYFSTDGITRLLIELKLATKKEKTEATFLHRRRKISQTGNLLIKYRAGLLVTTDFEEQTNYHKVYSWASGRPCKVRNSLIFIDLHYVPLLKKNGEECQKRIYASK